MALKEVRVPVPLARDVIPPYDDLELRLVADHSNVTIQPDGDGVGFPVQVADLPGADATQVLLFREHRATSADAGAPHRMTGNDSFKSRRSFGLTTPCSA